MTGEAGGRRPRDRFGRPKPRGTADELAGSSEPDERDIASGLALERAVGLFDRARFFEAHELFELIWNSPSTAPSDRRFWKGVTQIAVGLCHAQRGNAAGAAALLSRAARQLEGYPSPHLGVDSRGLIEIARQSSHAIRQRGLEALADFPRFPRA